MDFLRDHVTADPAVTVMCFSGRGGEVRDQDGTWRRVSRDEVGRCFREGMADILLCTDAAAEGLNFQFCGALINYDMPWNPMRVEQRIGRIDRLGQQFERVRIVNLHYADTVEADVYCSLRDRIGLFQSVVGALQPILAKLPSLIADRVLRRKDRSADPEMVHDAIVSAVNSAGDGGFDLDSVTDADLEELRRRPPSPPLDMNGLELLLCHPEVLPPGLTVRPMGKTGSGRSAHRAWRRRCDSRPTPLSLKSIPTLWNCGHPATRCSRRPIWLPGHRNCRRLIPFRGCWPR